MAMDFINKYKDRKNTINALYIDACILLKQYADASKLNISEIANAMKYVKLHMNVDSYTLNDQLEVIKNEPTTLENLLNEVANYGNLYKGSIKEDTFKKFKHVKIKIEELQNFSEIDYPPKFSQYNETNTLDKSLVDLKADKIQEVIDAFAEIHGIKSFYNHDYFSPFEACCLIAGKLPRHLIEKAGAFDICQEWEFLAAREYIKQALKEKRLYLTEECLSIPAINLKKVLYEDGKIIEGFNDDILLSIYEHFINPVLIIDEPEALIQNDMQPIRIAPRKGLEGSILKSYPMMLENRIEELEEQLYAQKQLSANQNAFTLIAVLKDLLLDIDITGYRFANSDNDNAKRKPIQGELSRHISEMNISGLKKRNVDDLFSLANDQLLETIKNKE